MIDCCRTEAKRKRRDARVIKLRDADKTWTNGYGLWNDILRFIIATHSNFIWRLQSAVGCWHPHNRIIGDVTTLCYYIFYNIIGERKTNFSRSFLISVCVWRSFCSHEISTPWNVKLNFIIQSIKIEHFSIRSPIASLQIPKFTFKIYGDKLLTVF